MKIYTSKKDMYVSMTCFCKSLNVCLWYEKKFAKKSTALKLASLNFILKKVLKNNWRFWDEKYKHLYP